MGRIASGTPLALDMHLVEVLWSAFRKMEVRRRPSLIYVCNSTLEAELLDQKLKDRSFHDGQIGKVSAVSKTGVLDKHMIMLSYAQFRSVLDHERRRSFLPRRLVVVCEQEPGTNMDAVIARGQFALIAKESLSTLANSNIKLLGLTYRWDKGGDWLNHVVQVMSPQPLCLSLDQSVSYNSVICGTPEVHSYDQDNQSRLCADAVALLKGGQHVVVYGNRYDLSSLGGRITDVSGLFFFNFPLHGEFFRGIGRDSDIDEKTRLVLAPPAAGSAGTLILMRPGCFSTPLPFSNVGMVISIVDNIAQNVYHNQLQVVVSVQELQSRHSLESQRLTGLGCEGRPASSTPRVVELFRPDLAQWYPTCDLHIQDGTHGPLEACFFMVAEYPRKALHLLPSFSAVEAPLDLIVKLRCMGLLRNKEVGCVLTSKGRTVKRFLAQVAFITLEAATAIAGIDVRSMGKKVARSILRLSFVKVYSTLFFSKKSMRLENGDAFVPFLQRTCIQATNGGPGRERIDRGLPWLMWVVFESVTYDVLHNGTQQPDIDNSLPFTCNVEGFKDAMSILQQWETLLYLGPIPDDWNTPLSMDEVAIIDQVVAQANYPTLLDVPCPVERPDHPKPEPLPVNWLRTRRPVTVEGEFDRSLYQARQKMVQDMRPFPDLDYELWAALPMNINFYGSEGTNVTGLMWIPYDIVKSLIGDLEDENTHPLVRATTMQ